MINSQVTDEYESNKDKTTTIEKEINKTSDHSIYNPAWASGPSEILRYFTCSGSPVQDRGFKSLRNFRKGRFKCLGSCAVANSHAAGS